MPADAFILKSDGVDIYVLGKEDPKFDRLMEGGRERRVLPCGHWGQACTTSPNGTLFGVYELLERYVGVRWLWPGQLGTYIPRSDSVNICSNLDETYIPLSAPEVQGVYMVACKGGGGRSKIPGGYKTSCVFRKRD